jgi:hypothetical protein
LHTQRRWLRMLTLFAIVAGMFGDWTFLISEDGRNGW